MHIDNVIFLILSKNAYTKFSAGPLILIFQLCGCSLLPLGSTTANIETLKGWSFQYNEGTDDYSVFFALLTETDRYVSSDVDVDIRIVNDNNEEVYKGTHSVTKDDFGYYSSQVAGEQYLANLRIPAADISAGTSANGKVYLTVYKGEALRFDEVNCEALYCLPVKNVQLTAEGLPKEINVKGYDGKVESTIKIEEVQYTYDKEFTSQLKITVAGIKTYGSANSIYDMISYKIYDSNNYMIDSGNLYLSSLSQGDKFKDDTIVVYDVVPGEMYTIKFSEYSW
ncbi:MAG: hypothetical protein E7436_04595 [Ruminococcaceae bacterium]|nr:hypothetical protein [Oscillospiraceae bacterium]